MTNDSDAILDDLLARWAWWLRPVHVGHGHERKSAVCGDYRSSRQYDDANGALDEQAEHTAMKAVNEQVDRLPDEPRPLRTAIYADGRRLVVGVDVYRSPRLPQGEARRVVIAAARCLLVERLTRAGLM